ncbi:MAG: DUF3899 domain-containing protein [Spirochaetales bacterium]|nr:DUF3899 domain-containing protein [Spirochaetales bacterium]
MKINGRKLVVLLIISAALFTGTAFLRGVLKAESSRDVVRCLSDAAFVAGVVMSVAGGLMWTADQGVADGLGYGVSRIFRKRGRNFEENNESYSEYRERKHSKKIRVAEFIICGGIFIVLALVLLIPYGMLL